MCYYRTTGKSTPWPTRNLLGRAAGDLFDQTDVRVLSGRLWPLRLRGSSMINRRTYQNAAALGIAGFALVLTMSAAFAFSASFAWCSGSPSFALTDVPPGTARLQFAMTDLNVPSFHHGGGTVVYREQPAVRCGAFSSGFTGPSPPPGQVHTYQFSIKALGPNGAVLATTTARRKFPE